MEATSLESVVKGVTTTPIFFDDDKEEFLPPEKQPRSNPIPQPTSNLNQETTNVPTELPQNSGPEDPIPHCSNHIAKKPEIKGPSRFKKAIEESAQAANRLRSA